MKNLNKIFSVASFGLLILSDLSYAGHYTSIYGLDAARNFHSHKNDIYMIQVGGFKSLSNAQSMERSLAASTHYPVQVKSHNNYYRVLIGPLHSSAEVREVAGALKHPVIKHQNKPASTPHNEPVDMSHRVEQKQAVKPYKSPIYSFDNTSSLDHIAHGFELSGALGGSWHQSKNATIRITADESDSNIVSGASSAILYSAGLGYHVFPKQFENRKFFTGLLSELNYYYGSSTISGNVWAYGSSKANNFTFKAPMTTSRLMIDLKPELFVSHQYTPYAVLGAGAAWNKMSYHESAINGTDPIGATSLEHHMNTTVAYDLGFGISRPITQNLKVSVEYLYTSLGTLLPSENATSPQTIVGAPGFSVQSQSVLARLSWKSNVG